ncbi:MAG: ATP-binding protein [Nitriliruptor sp.]|nr:MAG: ATP-binding protein [Nitriliruptor sp.]
MSAPRQEPATIGLVLGAQRRSRFVGRRAELELFRSAIAATTPDPAVIHLHGPGGIGKTSVLEAFAGIAAAHGASVVRLDARELPASPTAVLDALRRHIEVPADGAIEVPGARLVLLIDTYERLAAVDDWVREQLLTRLPTDAVTVLAGRTPPGPGWRADPAWRDLLRVVSLRNLGPDDSRDYLAACGVDSTLHERLIDLTHGHPLGLSLCTDVVVRGGDIGDDGLHPDLVADLVRSFVDVVPDAHQRIVLAACAQARVTTEALLRAVLEFGGNGQADADAAGDGTAQAHELFSWLHGLSFVEVGPDGVFPHELARDVLDADLRWRDAAEYTRIFRRVADHIRNRVRAVQGREQQRAISDLKFLFRNIPGVLSPVDWDAWGQHHPEPATPHDRAAVLALIAAAEGEQAGQIAARWWAAQPEGFSVLRGDDDRVRGVVCLVDLSAADAEDREADPGAAAVWEHAHTQRPPRAGEVVTQTRFIVDRDAYQGPSPTLNAVPIVTLQRQLTTPNLAWDYLTMHEPDAWDDFFALADLHRVPEADFEVEGRRYGVFAHDFRLRPVDALIELWVERSLAQDPSLQLGPDPRPQVLSQAGFTDAVRQALRDLHRPDLLARNPLLDTRLVRQAAGDTEPDAVGLAGLVSEAIDALRQHPRDDKLLRAVEATYLAPAPTQEAAAARLGLPFSTYRRHLTQGTERIVAWLWEREVYGPGGPR